MELDIGKNTKELLEVLATKLGITIEQIYPYFIKQQIIEGYIFFFMVALCSIISIIIIKLNYHKADFDDPNKHAIFTIIGLIALGMTTIVIVCGTSTMLSGILNPEYNAIREMLNFIK